jgi:hypothetical protein
MRAIVLLRFSPCTRVNGLFELSSVVDSTLIGCLCKPVCHFIQWFNYYHHYCRHHRNDFQETQYTVGDLIVVFLHFRKEIQYYDRANISGVSENGAIYSYSGTSGVLVSRFERKVCAVLLWCLIQKHGTLIRASTEKRRAAIIFIRAV